MPSLFVTGANILDSAQVNTATGAGNEGQGTITVNNGNTLFEADDFIVFDVQNTTADGELDGGSGFIGAVVYDSYQDFLDGIPKYTYTPMNPGQEANVQNDLSGLGDSYVRFNANVLTSSDPGAPTFNELLITPNIDWYETAPTSGETINRYTDFDFDDSGSIDAGTTEDANGQFSVTDWNNEVQSQAAASSPDFVISGTSGDDTIDAAYTGDPNGDVVDGNDAADGSNDDLIDARGGDDSVAAGAGNDTVLGGRGQDTIDGGDGADLLYGDSVNVDLAALASSTGGASRSLTVSNSSDDRLDIWRIDETGTPQLRGIINPGGTFGTSTADGENWVLRDEDGNYLEVIEITSNQTVNYGSEGLNDSIDGGLGNDTIYGQFGDDTLMGGDGDDTIFGGSGDDLIDGGAGNDTIEAGSGSDDISGGTGDDTFVVTGSLGFGNNSVLDGGEDGPDDGTPDGDIDILDLSALTAGVDYTISYDPVGGDVEGASGSQSSEDGVVTFADGSTLTFSNIETVVCFVRGTEIETDRGTVLIEQLSQGDLVLTRDRGFQPIRWIGSTIKTHKDLQQFPNLRPIRLKCGSLGPDMPSQDLLVSPQHRVLVRSKIANRMFSENEVLVAAKHLLSCDLVEIAEDLCEVEYFHMLFDQHEIVTANGAESESMFTGPQALKAIAPSARAEIFSLFPELMDRNYVAEGCRLFPNGRQARKLVYRHNKNKVDLLDSMHW